MKTEIEQLRKEFNDKLDALVKKEETQFEVGKWYKWLGAGFCIANFQGMPDKGFGINDSSGWNSTPWYWKEPKKWTPATPEEVKTALIKEAEKRGFKEGVTFKSSFGGDKYTCHENKLQFHDLYPFCLYATNSLGQPSGIIYDNETGEWAEIVKDEVIKIGSFDVKKLNDSEYSVGCRTIQKKNVQYIKDFMISKDFKKVAFDGAETDVETLIKILSL